jgi:hypothetical protein
MSVVFQTARQPDCTQNQQESMFFSKVSCPTLAYVHTIAYEWLLVETNATTLQTLLVRPSLFYHGKFLFNHRDFQKVLGQKLSVIIQVAHVKP